eukprot:GHVU01037146.1.p1 GENE.GHVU01037146.1~~GHVU01037146.1.p1  ORF type:complete len:197 (-),score=15.43 GHVU01037146.1:422-1012(-)
MYYCCDYAGILAERIRWRDAPVDRQAGNVVDIILRYDEGHGDRLASRCAKEIVDNAAGQRRRPEGVAWHCHSQVVQIVGEVRVAAYSIDGGGPQFRYLAENGSVKQELYGCLRLFLRKGDAIWRTRALWLCVCLILRPDGQLDGRELIEIILGRAARALELIEWVILPQSRVWLEDVEYLENDTIDGEEGYSEIDE